MDVKKVEYCSGDAISSLPDEILTRILCLVPTKRAASTTILSKRWRNMFPMMIRHLLSQHHLQFDDSDLLYHPKEGRIENFRAFVDSTLSLQQQEDGYRNPIKKLSLKVKNGFNHIENHANRWISNALERGVSELDLRITMPFVPDPEEPEQLEPYQWPLVSTIFTSNTLVKLVLGTRVYIGGDDYPKDEFFLPVLKSLFLYTICFEDDDLKDFLSGCPVLEELYIDHTNIDPTCWSTHSQIAHPTIKRLTIHRYLLFHNYRVVAFRTPNLVYLDYSDHVESCDYKGADFVDSLLEARIDLVCPDDYPGEPEDISKFISWICNVQTLYLTSSTVEMMCESLDYWHTNGGFPMFKNLVNLTFESKTKKGWKVIWSLIKNSPMLENLIIKGFYCIRRNCEVNIDGNMLKVLEIHGYRGSAGEVSQVKRFLWEMKFLKLMKVGVYANVDDDKKLQLTTDLFALPKGFSKCQIHLL